MKKILFIAISLLFITELKAQDMILLRSGEEINCKIEIINNEAIIYQIKGTKGQVTKQDIYMIKYEKRGDEFFKPNGDLLYKQSSSVRQSRNEMALYLCRGAEIMCTDVNITEESVFYKPADKKGVKLTKRSKDSWLCLPKEDVFLIKYPDGIREIITNINDETIPNVSIGQQTRIKHPFIPINSDPRFPCPAEIIGSNGKTLDVIIYDLEREYVHYRQKEWQDGPVFRMKRSNIKELNVKK